MGAFDGLVLRLAGKGPMNGHDDAGSRQGQADQGHDEELPDQARLAASRQWSRLAAPAHGNAGTVTAGVVVAGVVTEGTVGVGVVTDVVTVGTEGSDASGTGTVTPAEAPAAGSTFTPTDPPFASTETVGDDPDDPDDPEEPDPLEPGDEGADPVGAAGAGAGAAGGLDGPGLGFAGTGSAPEPVLVPPPPPVFPGPAARGRVAVPTEGF